MKDLKDYITTNGKTIDDLSNSIEEFMDFYVDGDDYVDSLEEGFEKDVKGWLTNEGFNVLPKKNVKNTDAMVEGLFSENIDRQIPDISVNCEGGLVMLELKYCRQPSVYDVDIEKVKEYIRQGKCKFAGVLFLDEVERTGWKTCGVYDNYYYLWKLYIPKFDAKSK